jgi:DNA-binding NarL/FixJ family response regulator
VNDGAKRAAGSDAAVVVELAIADVGMSERIRRVVVEELGFSLADESDQAASIRVTDDPEETEGNLPVLVLAGNSGRLETLPCGVAAILSEHSDAATLGAAIRAVLHGLTVLSEEARGQVFGSSQDEGLEPAEDDQPAALLTARELQVLALLAEGASNKVIARALGITPHTAKFHVASIVAKLGASGRTDAVAKAMRLGLVMI